MAVEKVISRPFSSTFGRLFKGISIGFILLIFLIVIFLIIIFIWAFVTGGNSPYPIVNYVYSGAVDPLINSGMFNYVKKALSYPLAVVNPTAQAKILEETTWTTYVEKNTNKDLGVDLKRFEATRNIIPLNYTQEIKAVAEGSILSLEGTTVVFSCLADEKEVPQSSFEKISEFYFYPYIEESFTYECVYDKEDFDIDPEKVTHSGKVQLKISYDFLTESSLIIYTLDKEIKNEMTLNDIDIFEGLSSKYLKDEISYAVSTEGPVKLGLQSYYSQPLSDEMEYILTIRVDDNNKWAGGIENIEEIDFLLSEGLVLNDERFEEIGVEDSLVLYRAKDAFVENLYGICAPEKEDTGLISVDCWRAGNLEDTTKFSVKEDSDKLTEELIKAKIRYRFGEIKQDTITFTNV